MIASGVISPGVTVSVGCNSSTHFDNSERRKLFNTPNCHSRPDRESIKIIQYLEFIIMYPRIREDDIAELFNDLDCGSWLSCLFWDKYIPRKCIVG